MDEIDCKIIVSNPHVFASYTTLFRSKTCAGNDEGELVLRLRSVGAFLLVWKQPCVSVGLYQTDAVIALLNGAPAQLSYNIGRILLRLI